MQEAAIRSFIAFDIEDRSVLKRLKDIQNLIMQTGGDLKLVKSQSIHITIRFLGDISPIMVDKIFEQMEQVHFIPFEVKIYGLGAFPSINYTRVLWAGMTEGVDHLQNIFTQLDSRLHTLGFSSDSRGFSPHLTIARVKSGRNKARLADCIIKNKNYEFGILKAECLRLKKSDLTPTGPIYSTLKEVCRQR